MIKSHTIQWIFLLIGLFVLFKSNAQTMNSIDVLQNLKPYAEFLEELKKEEFPNAQKEKGFVRLDKSISLQYSFITLELNSITKPADSSQEHFDQHLLCEIRFEIVQDKMVLKEIYHESPSRKETLTTSILKNRKLSEVLWKTKIEDQSFCKEYIKYLTVADEIASLAMNCASGDNYRPGFYSEIRISDEGIALNQINRMNSRSLDHKENYSMRDLEFLISFGSVTKQNSFNEYTIGRMQISFSDHSSPNNKFCGERIQKKIKEISAQWDK